MVIPRNRFFAPALVLVAAFGGFFAASRYFFPLKKLAHWDEIVRYLYPGIDQFHYSWGGLFSALSDPPDNGQLIVFLIRIIRNFFPFNHQMALYVYKLLVFCVTILVLFWFGKNVFRKFSFAAPLLVLLYLLAPMTWIQANEVMVEPIVLPLSLIWYGLSLRLLGWQGLTSRDRWFLSGKLFLSSLLFLWTSYQFLLQALLVASLGFFIWYLLRERRLFPALKKIIAPLGMLLAIFFMAIIGWSLGHWGNPLLQIVYFFVKPLGASLQDLAYSALYMTSWDRLLFGPRNFLWIYFPPLLLLVPALIGFIRSRKNFSEEAKCFVIMTCCSAVLTALAFKGNLQPRYFHPSNMLVLIVASLGVGCFFFSVWNRPGVIAASISLVAITYAAFDYLPVYRSLPSLANMQIYGTYERDDGSADQALTLFGSVERQRLVSFPQLRRSYYYPAAVDIASPPSVSSVVDKISGFLQEDLPVIAAHQFIYYNQQSVQLQYLDRFGSYPPKAGAGRPVLYVRLSFPKGSPYHSVYYSEWGGCSDEEAERFWQERVALRPHEMVHEERTPQYTITIARSDYEPVIQEGIDWSRFESVREWVLKKVKGEEGVQTDGRLGWKGKVVIWILNLPLLRGRSV